jgi:hypothetical protein
MSETVQYGWYSPKAAAQTGTTIYRTPEGTEVEVTGVDEDEDPYGDRGSYYHGTSERRGPVVEWVRYGRTPTEKRS